jgi:hypothetical protein
MLVSIGTYTLCNGTRAGGVAISNTKFDLNRAFDVVIPYKLEAPVSFDRTTRRLDLTFIVQRVHASVAAAEDFILLLEEDIPLYSTGPLTITTSGPSPVSSFVPNGAITEHALMLQDGATTFHQYHIVGGKPPTPS